MENAPGPSIIDVAAMVTNKIEIHGSSAWVTAAHNSTTAINAPTKGVHNPTRKSIAAHAPIMCGIIDKEKDKPMRWTTHRRTSRIAATIR